MMIGDTNAEPIRLAACRARRASLGLLDEPIEDPRAGAGSTVSILFVDDRDRDALRVVAALAACRDLNVEIDHVSCPAEARRLWESGIHDLALFDIWLGSGTSVGLLAALAEDAAARPIVVLSNLPPRETRTLGSGDLLVHSKDNLSSAALALTLSSALALARRMAVILDA